MSDVGSFWARRRAAVQAEEQADLRAVEEAQAEAIAAERAERDDAEILEEMGLPDPAGMKAGDDFTGFMSRDVPEHLRRQALRTLWRSNPVLACVDGLNEYDDDYRAAMLLQEPIKTAYQVGKGMTKHVEEMERQAAAAELESRQSDDETPDLVEAEEETVALAETETASRDETVSEETIAAEGPLDHVAKEDEEECAPSPRRMRFHFEEAAV
ncbi:MAG: DUF3306 domain-containing protein [Roseobacter sp.]